MGHPAPGLEHHLCACCKYRLCMLAFRPVGSNPSVEECHEEIVVDDFVTPRL